MGQSEADSVADRHGRVHGVPNLYVVGESGFTGSSGAVNPALTATALAIRVADHLLATLG
jgi:choline dehydrogenase-like flavoprotein